MKVELIDTRDALPALAGDWNRLALADGRDGFFRTAGWYQAWMNHIRPDARPFVIVVKDDAGRVGGLAPLCQAKYHDLGLRFNSIRWAGREVVSGDFLNIVCEPDFRAATTSAVLDFLWSRRREWPLLVFGELVDGDPLLGAVESLARSTGIPLRRQEERICPYIALPRTFDEYLQGLGSSTRYHIRRRTRDIIEKNNGRIETYSQPDSLIPHLETLSRLHEARWRSENQPGTLGRPGFAPFLREICARPPAGAACRLHVLRNGDHPVAALLAFYFGRSALYYQAGWDPDSAFATLSPATVVMAHSIRDAIENGLDYYEFLRGDEAYKGRWTKTSRRTVTLIAAGNFQGRLCMQLARFKDLLKARLPGSATPETETEAVHEETVRDACASAVPRPR